MCFFFETVWERSELAKKIHHMNVLTTNQSRIVFQDVGSGPAVLLVHGFPLDRSMWQYQIDAWSDRFRLIVPDLPGFGESQFKGDRWTLASMADELAEVLVRLQIPQIIYCGLSMGGYIGWQFWQRHPQRLNRLIACNTRAAADTETVRRARSMQAAMVMEQGIGNLPAEMISRLFAFADDPHRSPDYQQAISSVRNMIQNADPKMVAAAQRAMAERPDATDWLPKIEIPILFVGGQYDPITPSDEMKQNQALARFGQWIEIADAGHLTPLENPTAFNAIL